MRFLLLACCLLAPPAVLAIDEAEQRERIAFETAKFESQIENNALIYGDPLLVEYLQGVMDRLYPDHPGLFRVRVFNDPNFNAFAVSSGGIYFHTGTLLRLTDEAQLAAILGHEGMHVLEDHTYRRIAGYKRTAGLTTFVGVVGLGFGVPPILADVIGYSSMAGFSREHERDSDEGGFQRMARAGYDLRGASEAFAVLERELLARNIKQGPYFFASHPRVRERVENMAALAQGAAEGGERGRERFLETTRGARMDALAQLHAANDHSALVFLLETEGLLATLPPEARYYLAEAYRIRSQAVRRQRGDKRSEQAIEAERGQLAERAAEEYRRTVEASPDFGPPFERLAHHELRSDRKAEALVLFTRFVELVPDPKQSGFARQHIETLTRELNP